VLRAGLIKTNRIPPTGGLLLALVTQLQRQVTALQEQVAELAASNATLVAESVDL
jgi:hypothetical protein